ncbi:tetratricopeptide repeat protein [Opitutus terrae]|uniref:Tetratricopeptide TPR_2 repeat protein n=1 Tax=Opitutus terrae (strain DSM 11246 / JCM 15787 / PB90-1) TaxID=452637 RepID=B1ZPA9_OPITP|nr:tetratricopeptide repeat protein [Opitutus terrae]ACB77598.1 Tetratricopeptide TPR_2 repeat protein [Opitutus terrae PB90-1]
MKPSAVLPDFSSCRGLRWAAGGLLLLTLTLLAYAPALRGGLLWDDDGHLTRPELRSVSGLMRIWTDVGATQQYYPLLHSGFWLEHRLWGESVTGYHLMNVVLHTLAALLVVAIVRRLFGARENATAWLAGALFALHPVGVESVAWISEQKNTLSAVFYLAAALVFLKWYSGNGTPAAASRSSDVAGGGDPGAGLSEAGYMPMSTGEQGRHRLLSFGYFLASFLFLCALLTKTVTATLPAALMVVLWWRRGRLGWRRDVLPLVPWLAAGVTAGLFTAWVERTHIGARGDAFALDFFERGLVAGRAILFYLGKLLWPTELVFIYPRWTIDAGNAWQWVFPLAVLALLIGLIALARRYRGPLAAFLFFAGTLFPALGFFDVYPFLYSYVADHFAYLASLGVIVPAAFGFVLAGRRLPRRARAIAPIAATVLLLTLAAATWRQSGHYRDAETLWRATLARNPGSSMAHNNLGEILASRPERNAEAIEHFCAAAQADPQNAPALNNLGLALAKDPTRMAEAIASYEQAIRVQPELINPRNNLGVLLTSMPGRLDDGITHLREAARMDPSSAGVRDNLGVALLRAGRSAEAAEEFAAAVSLQPDAAALRNRLGVALANVPGREAEALAEFRTAVELDPNSAEARMNLARALASQPEHGAEAIEQLEAALRIAPTLGEAHGLLGRILLTIPERLREATEHLQQAVAVQPESAELRQAFGVALLRDPARTPDAIRELEAAVRLAPDMMEAHYALGVALSGAPARQADARRHFRRTLELQPDFGPARQALAELEATRND